MPRFRINPKLFHHLSTVVSGSLSEAFSVSLASKEDKVKKAATLQEQYDCKTLKKIPFVPPESAPKAKFAIGEYPVKPIIDGLRSSDDGESIILDLRVNLPLSLDELKVLLKENNHSLKDDGGVCDTSGKEKFKVCRDKPLVEIEVFGGEEEGEKENLISLTRRILVPIETLVSFGLISSKREWEKVKKHTLKAMSIAFKVIVTGASVSNRGHPKVPVMRFPEVPTPEQEEIIQTFLSYLKNSNFGLSSLSLDQVRYFSAPYFGNYSLGDPRSGYLLVKEWVRLMEAEGNEIQDFWYEVIKNPNEYLNPTKYIPNEDSFDATCDI